MSSPSWRRMGQSGAVAMILAFPLLFIDRARAAANSGDVIPGLEAGNCRSQMHYADGVTSLTSHQKQVIAGLARRTVAQRKTLHIGIGSNTDDSDKESRDRKTALFCYLRWYEQHGLKIDVSPPPADSRGRDIVLTFCY